VRWQRCGVFFVPGSGNFFRLAESLRQTASDASGADRLVVPLTEGKTWTTPRDGLKRSRQRLRKDIPFTWREPGER
jgi:hypothetical protein